VAWRSILKKTPYGSYLHDSLSTQSKILKAGKIVSQGSLTWYFCHLKLLCCLCSSQISIQCWLITQSLWLYHNRFISILNGEVSWCQKGITDMAHSWLLCLNVTYKNMKFEFQAFPPVPGEDINKTPFQAHW